MRSGRVPWLNAVALVSRLASDDVVVTLVKDGDRRLSRLEDVERLLRVVQENSGRCNPVFATASSVPPAGRIDAVDQL
jgi:hypothetical protein